MSSKVYVGHLKKLGSVPGSPGSVIRTNDIDGWFIEPPARGKSFRFFSKPLTEGTDVRQITTSPVFTVEDISDGQDGPAEVEFTTENSVYNLTWHFLTKEDAS